MCALLSASTSLLSLNVEGCHRLFGSRGCAPEGFELRGPGARRPGTIARRPPGCAPAAGEGGSAGGAAPAGGGNSEGEGSSSSPEPSPRLGGALPEVPPVAA